MRKITKILIHCSDSPDARDSVDASVIRSWHLERGFTDIGYHAVVLRGGEVEVGRPESVLGAHCVGHNRASLGVCWVGRDAPTAKQYTALTDWVADRCVQYSIDAAQVLGHREAAPMGGKTCPNLNMGELRTHVANRIQSLKGN